MNLIGIKNGIESVNDAAFAKLASVAGLPIVDVVSTERKDQNDYLPLCARVPQGTQILLPDYFDEACIGYEFMKHGGVRLAYAGELCVRLLMRNSQDGISFDDAVERLAKTAESMKTTPAFIWGLDA